MTAWIAGYGDKISVRAGETVAFMVSSEGTASYDVDIVRIISGEDDPNGPGCNMPVVSVEVARQLPARRQAVFRGSYGELKGVQTNDKLAADFTIAAFIFPTTPDKGRQFIIAALADDSRIVLGLNIDDKGALAAEWQDAAGEKHSLSTGVPLKARTWYLVSLAFDSEANRFTLTQAAKEGLHAQPPAVAQSRENASTPAFPSQMDLLLATSALPGSGAERHSYNGKIDSPIIVGRHIAGAALQSLLEEPHSASEARAVAILDFSLDIPSSQISEVSGTGRSGRLSNLPTRGVTGWLWSGEEFNWRARPEHYRAVHFHDDDLYDAGWEVDFSYPVPNHLPSGVYAARLTAPGVEEFIPFVVRPERGAAKKNTVAFLVPDASYMAYANYLEQTKAPEWFEPYLGRLIELSTPEIFLLEHPEFDACLYSLHSDGSGVHYSSRLRPILSMRPKFRSSLGGDGCGAWQFKADSHIWSWLDRIGIPFDVLCDEDLDREGLEALDGYDVLITGTHPEYVSARMRSAHEAFLERGGRLMYMGGNGFYWKVAYDAAHPGVVELRRGDSGSRAWASSPGEAYMAFGAASSGLGGTWRTSGRAPQSLTGVGFTAQGFDYSAPYERKPGSYDVRAQFMFEGVTDELLGDFGLVGGGAAGLEIDRVDAVLGTPEHTLVLASSSRQSPHYLLVAEEILEMHPFISGDVSDQVRADLTFYETGWGGAVFSTGSIAWSGALSHNNYANNIARITENTLRRFMVPESFARPDLKSS
ncbi:MAG TPA: N,N-dimethylformamidase beta subunit family domain-containing protein [Steroidobacteraceae bacterium]|nr:N,N-dimethylformamidase beta subunit family domain-containing protein [Steroidobacteraceae bacterium]